MAKTTQPPALKMIPVVHELDSASLTKQMPTFPNKKGKMQMAPAPMTVSDLAAILSTYPPDAFVRLPELEVDSDCYWRTYESKLEISWERQETIQEHDLRIKQEKAHAARLKSFARQHKQTQMEQEKKLLAKLTKKYGTPKS